MMGIIDFGMAWLECLTKLLVDLLRMRLSRPPSIDSMFVAVFCSWSRSLSTLTDENDMSER
jgi:hypothetical protein